MQNSISALQTCILRTCKYYIDKDMCRCTVALLEFSQDLSSDSCGVTDPAAPVSVENSHFLCNGLVGNQQKIAESKLIQKSLYFIFLTVVTLCISLCKHLPGAVKRLSKRYETDKPPNDLPPNMHQLEDFYSDYIALAKIYKLRVSEECLSTSVEDIKPADLATLPPLIALAIGYRENTQAGELYDRMMEVAKWKGLTQLIFVHMPFDIIHCVDWNTYSDEEAVPQLRQVSCTALACLLKHTGLYNYALNYT